jgi:hypothetical protein
MQPEDQQSSEAEEQQGEALPGEAPFYEFSAVPAEEQSVAGAAQLSVPAEEIASGNIPTLEASAEEIQAGLVYPPPPSFYQHMQVPAEKPALPGAPPVPPVPPVSAGSRPPTLPPGEDFVYAAPNRVQGYTGFAPPSVSSPQPRRSRKTLWITLSVVGVVLLFLCGLCGWNIVAPVFQDTSAAINVATDYYQNVENGQYSAAYAYVQINNLTEAAFAQQAQAREAQYGQISSFELNAPSAQISDDGTITAYTMTVSVVRAKDSYSAQLTLQDFGGTWKITAFNSI